MNWPNRALFFVNICLVCGIGWLYLANGFNPPSPSLDWKDYVTILLTVVTIILAAVALFLAVAAVWGYTTIWKHAEETARTAAQATAVATATKVARAVATREVLSAEKVAPEPPQEETDALASLLMQGRNGEDGEDDGPH